MSHKKQFIKVGSNNIAYYDIGPKNARPIVLIHGLFGMSDALLPFIAELKDLRTIAIDLPGQGQSQPAGSVHGIESYAKLVIELINSLDLKDAIIFGHSYGSTVALAATSLDGPRIKRLVMMNPYPEANNNPASLVYRGLFQIGKRLPRAWKQALFYSHWR